MKCVICGGEASEKLVEEEVKVGADHVLVKLKAEVCGNCHERYYPEGTVDYLSRIKKELKERKTKGYREVGKVYELSS